MGYDSDDETDPLDPYGPGEAQAAPAGGDGTYGIYNQMGDRYRGEDEPGNATWAGQQRSVTHYDSDAEQAAHALTFDGGYVRQGDSDEYYETIGAGAAHYKGSEPDRNLFVMDTEGQFYGADGGAEEADRPGERYHHSSLVAGGAVAAAGEIQVRDGEVELISDRSGHYTPNLQMTGQAIDGLEAQGVPIEQVGVELGAKGPYADAVTGSAVEVQAYMDRPGDDDRTVPDRDIDGMLAAGYVDAAQADALRQHPEALLRYRHDQKAAMLAELRQNAASPEDAPADV